MEQIFEFYTYNKGRKCLHCRKEIPDQAHGAQLHCKREVLPDGSVKSCKDDRHAILRSARDLPYKKIADHFKEMDIQIEKLRDDCGEKVTTELINRYGIILHRPVELEIEENTGAFIFYFTRYAFKKINNSNFKIYKHGRLF